MRTTLKMRCPNCGVQSTYIVDDHTAVTYVTLPYGSVLSHIKCGCGGSPRIEAWRSACGTRKGT